jgi:glucose/arabinose dehydrogenase
MRPAGLLAAAVAALAAAGCGSSGPPPAPAKPAKLDFAAAPYPKGGAGGVDAEQVVTGLKEPTLVTGVPGRPDDVVVLERAGRISLIAGGAKQPVADLSDQVSTAGGEQGLLGLAFAPGWAASGRAYAYLVDKGDDLRLVELRRTSAEPLRLEPVRTVLKIHHPTTTAPGTPKTNEDLRVHNGGQIAFGPDGLLYIGVGDGGGQGDPADRAQDASLLLGKILRIDPRRHGRRPYATPRDNPFASRRRARPEIYALGLRNPYRFSFDRDGSLLIGDVGQSRVEEIDVIAPGQAGANLGWSCFEGTERFKPCQVADMVAPAISRPSSGVAKRCAAITGGVVVRGAGIPALEGRYVYTDFCEGRLRTARIAGGRATEQGDTGFSIPAVSSFGVDGRKRLYATAYVRGTLYRLVAAS